jgi:acetylornithine deacetylase/succinyl-diaminopimelate desuccinylase-like protein
MTYNHYDQIKKRMTMTNQTDNSLQYYQRHAEDLFEEFLELLRIPSVSTDEAHQKDILHAADFLAEKLTRIGLENVAVFPTARHPIVYGENIGDPNRPTILIYGHYDVQPPDPIDSWESPPFDPQVKGDYLYARGASDMKGQIWATISAIQSILETTEIPVNIKFLIEGEEEIGSPNLEGFLDAHQTLLECDIVLNPDAGMLAPDKPTIIYALRGLAYFELRVYGPKADLHSGIFGGVVANPANVLSKIIAEMHDDQGKVSLPGFYDQVRQITEEESDEMSKIGTDEAFFKTVTGVPALGGEVGFSPIERVGARPTLDVNGFYSGYIDQGAKTIIPAYAMAKISTRLVPDQDPEVIHECLRAFLQEKVPDTVTWELDYLSGAPAYIAEEQAPGVSLFADALRKTWGVQPLKKREGGSIPVATSMKKALGVDSIITGFGLPADQIHSPNERLHLPTHQKGVEALIHFFLSFD